jgi:trehalose 6-phosphate synthase/phosphatase
MSAEHGCFLKLIPQNRGDLPRWQPISSTIDQAADEWRPDVSRIMSYYTERTPGSFIEPKRASLTWHYRLSDPDFGSWQAKELQTHLEHTVATRYPVEIIIGKKNVEVRPQCCNKGEIVKTLLERHGATNASSEKLFVFCAGDDRTDEDMFRALLEAFPSEEDQFVITCCIGPHGKKSMARYRMATSQQIVSLLLCLASFSGEQRLSGVTL